MDQDQRVPRLPATNIEPGSHCGLNTGTLRAPPRPPALLVVAVERDLACLLAEVHVLEVRAVQLALLALDGRAEGEQVGRHGLARLAQHVDQLARARLVGRAAKERCARCLRARARGVSPSRPCVWRKRVAPLLQPSGGCLCSPAAPEQVGPVAPRPARRHTTAWHHSKATRWAWEQCGCC